MSKTQKFRVVREHEGDRFYSTGETREAAPEDVKHLVPHVLEPIVKAEPPLKNKAEGAAPANKASKSAKAD